MKLTIKIAHLLFLLIAFPAPIITGRSVHRTEYKTIPIITIGWTDQSKKSALLRNSHLEQYPLFELFNKEYFQDHILPDGILSPRHTDKKTVQGAQLKEHLETVLQEIQERKQTYTHFILLTGKNFNRYKRVGMLILKYKHGPYIVKMSTETPESFIDPFCKGLDNIWFFLMGGGINRHLAGFTRVKNRENVKKKLDADPRWASIDVPRKWHWLPKNPKFLIITGDNIGIHKKQSIEIPSTYGIIADEIDIERELKLNNPNDTNLALNLCNYLEHAIDAHINNFVIEKNTGKIFIIDTEHFPSVIGIKEKIHIDSYVDWYEYLIKKCGNDWFFRTKKKRIAHQLRSQTIKLI